MTEKCGLYSVSVTVQIGVSFYILSVDKIKTYFYFAFPAMNFIFLDFRVTGLVVTSC